MRTITFLSSAFVVLALTSCSSKEASNQPEEAFPTRSSLAPADHKEGMHAPKADGQKEQLPPTMTEGGLPKDFVCMVNDAYMGKQQFPVEFEGKMYYGCCEMCVKTIKSERQARVAEDPVSGKKVDKSSAFIALKEGPTKEEVLYFESEANYKRYLAQVQTNP